MGCEVGGRMADRGFAGAPAMNERTGMKKNNYIVLCLAVLVSAFLLWLWFSLHFDEIDAPLDLVLSVIWWAIIGGAVYLIHRVEKKRQERLRTCFVAKNGVFNPEAGSKPIAGLEVATECIQDLIANLKYGFSFEDLPEDAKFLAVVRSKKFDLKREQKDENTTEERLEWEGEVALVNRPNDDPKPFASKEELQQILQALAAAA